MMTSQPNGEVLRVAMILQRAYEEKAYHAYKLLARRGWDALPASCQREFITIVESIAYGDGTYLGEVMPEWVTELVYRNFKDELNA